MHLATYLTLLGSSEKTLAEAYRQVAAGHTNVADVRYTCENFARTCAAHAEALDPITARYADRHPITEPDRLRPPGLPAPRPGPVGMLRDLQDLYQLAGLVEITWTLVGQAAAGARDKALLETVERCHPDIATQQAWLRMHMKAAAPQTLLVAP